MQVKFDHLSISAVDPEAIRDFLVALLDLTPGDRPNMSFKGYFLFAGKQDVIHIFGKNPTHQDNENSQPIIHHFCFFSDDYAEVIRRIEKMNLSFSANDIPGSNVKQLFVRGPENLLVEIKAVSELSP